MPGLQPLVFEPRPDVRLIAADMDGTLLDDWGQLHDDLWPLMRELTRRGVVFCPASGRQYANLHARFREVADDVAFIAANGSLVVLRGHELSSAPLEAGVAARIAARVRTLRRARTVVDGLTTSRLAPAPDLHPYCRAVVASDGVLGEIAQDARLAAHDTDGTTLNTTPVPSSPPHKGSFS